MAMIMTMAVALVFSLGNRRRLARSHLAVQRRVAQRHGGEEWVAMGQLVEATEALAGKGMLLVVAAVVVMGMLMAGVVRLENHPRTFPHATVLHVPSHLANGRGEPTVLYHTPVLHHLCGSCGAVERTRNAFVA